MHDLSSMPVPGGQAFSFSHGTDGVQLFLSEASVALDLITAKSSEINVNIPIGDGDWKELVIPEQFVHKIHNNRVMSKVSDLYG